MAGLSLAIAGQTTTDVPGVPGRLVAPLGAPIPITTTVFAEGRPLITAGSPVPVHGNPFNPKAPGFNPPCAAAVVTTMVIPNILIEGKPAAVASPSGVGGSVCTCGHRLMIGTTTIVAGL